MSKLLRVVSKLKTEVLHCFTNVYFLLSALCSFQFGMLSLWSDPAGAFWGFCSDCPWPWGHAVPKGRWKEGLETSLLHAQGLGHLLCTQRKDKGMTNQTMTAFDILFLCKCKQKLNLVPNIETWCIVETKLVAVDRTERWDIIIIMVSWGDIFGPDTSYFLCILLAVLQGICSNSSCMCSSL